jgi:hypothetical protein
VIVDIGGLPMLGDKARLTCGIIETPLVSNGSIQLKKSNSSGATDCWA